MGAIREDDSEKLDYGGCLSPHVLTRYCEYMQKYDAAHGSSDNWKKGIPPPRYFRGMFRHFVELWNLHEAADGEEVEKQKIETALCAIMFNAMGYLYELLKVDTSHMSNKEAKKYNVNFTAIEATSIQKHKDYTMPYNITAEPVFKYCNKRYKWSWEKDESGRKHIVFAPETERILEAGRTEHRKLQGEK